MLSCVCRCQAAGGPGLRGGGAGAGERGSAGVHLVHLPSVPGEVQPAGGASAGAAWPQHAGGGLPVLHAPERRGALQQPAHRDAARQESLCVRDTHVPPSCVVCVGESVCVGGKVCVRGNNQMKIDRLCWAIFVRPFV